MPQFNVGRAYHACGAFLTDNGTIVLIVTGGSNAVEADLDSTEIMESGGVWEMNARLPFPLTGLSGATVDNTFFIFGGETSAIFRHRKTIYRYNVTGQAWERAGQMTKRRGFTAVTVLPDVYHWCP